MSIDVNKDTPKPVSSCSDRLSRDGERRLLSRKRAW